MADSWKPLSKQEMKSYNVINKESVEFLMTRYNKVNRWVIADMIRRSAYHYPDKTAMIFGDKKMTYAETGGGVQPRGQCAHRPRHQEVRPRGHPGPQHDRSRADLVRLLQGRAPSTWPSITCCGARTSPTASTTPRASSSSSRTPSIDLVKDVLDEMPTVKTWIWSRQGAGKPPVSDKFQDFEPWYKAYPATEPDTVLRIEDPVQMTYTSGTEALPKGVIITNQALMAEYMGCIVDGQYDEDDVQVNALPIYHCAQRDVFLNPVFWVGGTNILIAPDMVQILKNIADYKATMFFAPPTVWIGLLRHPDFDEVRPHEPQEVLLRGIHHARGDPQGDHGEIPRVGNLELLRPDGAGALSHGPQGEGRPAQAGLRGPGRHQHGDEARGRQLQSRLAGRVFPARSAARAPTP